MSSGGFSNYFAAPDYQVPAVSSYLASIGDLYAGKFTAAGRGFPDVSAQSEFYNIVLNTFTVAISGTSAAAPVFASIIALLNDRLAAVGKPQLGFLNPLLYENPNVLNDIVSGSNPGCGTAGFPAISGWDPVSSAVTSMHARG